MSHKARPRPLTILAATLLPIMALLSIMAMTGRRHPARGVDTPLLVATAGMTYQDVQKQSTLDLGGGVYDDGDQYATRERSFVGTAVFDWHMPGSRLTFPGCRYYSMQTGGDDDPHIAHLWITTAQDSLTWDQLKQHLKALRRQLHEDGWKPELFKDQKTGKVTSAESAIADMMDKPDRKDWDGSAGGVGASYGKGDVALAVSAKRLTPPGEHEDPLSGKEFIYWVELVTRGHWEHYHKGSGETLPK